MEEIWRNIKDYEGLYQVSNMGNVRSLPRNTTKGRVLAQSSNGNGYMHIVLTKNGVQKDKLVHRLVAEAFLLNPDSLPAVNHKDENKTNNCVDNLEWCTYKYNNTYGTIIKRNSLTNSIPVSQYSLNGEWIQNFNSAKEAKYYLGKTSNSINNCLKGRAKSAFGFIWKYANSPR